jgi:hypothetical protein
VVVVGGGRGPVIRPDKWKWLDGGKSCGQSCRRWRTTQASSWAVIEVSARDQPASRTPRDTTRSLQAAYFDPPTPCAAPRFPLLCCSISVPCLNPHPSLSPPYAGSPFRELSQITSPPASLVRLTFAPPILIRLFALLCMALSFHPHPLTAFCMFSEYPHPSPLIPHITSLQPITLHHGAESSLVAAPVEQQHHLWPQRQQHRIWS